MLPCSRNVKKIINLSGNNWYLNYWLNNKIVFSFLLNLHLRFTRIQPVGLQLSKHQLLAHTKQCVNEPNNAPLPRSPVLYSFAFLQGLSDSAAFVKSIFPSISEVSLPREKPKKIKRPWQTDWWPKFLLSKLIKMQMDSPLSNLYR